MSGSNTSYTVASGGTITGGGSNDTIHMLGGGYVGLTAGSGDTVDMSGGILQALTGVTNIILNGSNDSVMTGANSIFDLNGSNGTINAGNDAYVGILAGNGDLVSLNGGTLQIASSVTNLLLGGSGVTIMGSNNDSMNVDGNNDLINMGTGCYVGILAGNDDSIEMNDGTLQTAASVTNMYLVGNYNTVATGGCSSIQIDGSDNFIVMGTNSYDGLLVGNGDSVSMSNGTLQAAASIGNILLMGSNDEALIDPSGQLSVNGSYDVINTGTSCFVGLLAGNYDTVNMSYGALDVSSGVLNALLNGIYDTVEVFAGANITVTGGSDILEMGAGDTVSILSGTGDSITLTNGTLNLLNLYPAPSINNLTLVGSGDVIYSYTQDTLTAGAYNTAVVNGASNSITLGLGSVVDLISGNGNNFFLSSGKINWGAGYSGGVYGSSDTIIGDSSADIYLVGSNDAVTLGADSLLNLGGGTNNNITLASGTVDLAASSTDGIVGTSNTIVASISDGVYISGDGNTLTASGTDFVSLVVGTNETFHMVTSTLSMGSTLDTTDILIGSWNTVSMGADSTLSVTGNHNIINAAPGATVTLTGSDSGDIIDLIGGTIDLGAGLSNVTIVGTGDQLIGPDASSFGSATTVTVEKVGPGGTLIPETTTFAVVYDPADIQDLITYFEANPNLSQSQIAAAESDSNYQSSLEAYLSTANVYGSSNSLPPNVLAMLDGYSSLYMALTGVSDADLAKDVYIEQQFSWVESTYLDPTNGDPCLPVDGLSSVLQNLMPALLSTNATTESLVSSALSLLEAGQAGATQGNQAPLLDDTAAKLELESAESPTGTSFSDLVYTPGRSTHWKVVLTQPGNNLTETAEGTPLISQVLSDIDTYVGPLIDLAAIISLNPEIIGLTALPALATTSIEVASTAYSLVQAGQDFANGEDLDGAFGVLGAIGGSLQQIGAAGQTAAEGNGLGFDVDAGLEQDVGQVLSNGVAAVDGAYGVDIAAQSGNVLAAITSSFGAVGGVAGVAGESTLQQFAQLGQGLASTALSGEQGDVLGALQSLVQSANAYQNLGGTMGIEQDVSAMVDAFEVDIYDPLANAASWLWNATSSQLNTIAQYFSNSPGNQVGAVQQAIALETPFNGEQVAGPPQPINLHGYIPASGDNVLLARLIYAEADGTSTQVMTDVGWTVVNRIGDSGGFASGGLSAVVNQPGQYASVDQDSNNWSAAANPTSLTGANAVAYLQALSIANGILNGTTPDPTQNSTFFYNGPAVGFFATEEKSGQLIITVPSTDNVTIVKIAGQ